MELHCWWSCAQCASYFLGSYNLRFNIPPNLPRALRKGAVSSGIFALTRFLTICFFFYKLPRISTKLGQNLKLVSGYKSYQQFDPKCYVGVTGVKSILKNQFYWKCIFSFILHSRVTWFMHIIRLKTLYKTHCIIFLMGSFGVIRCQKVIFIKNVLTHFSESLLSWDLNMCCGYKKQTKVIRYEFNLGSCGVAGVKNTNLPTLILCFIIALKL